MFQNDLSSLYRGNIVGGDPATQIPLANVWGQWPYVAGGPCANIGNPATGNVQFPGQFVNPLASQGFGCANIGNPAIGNVPFPGQFVNPLASQGYGFMQPFSHFNTIPYNPYSQFGQSYLPAYATNTPFTNPFLTHPAVQSPFIGQNLGQNLTPFSMSHFNTPWGIQSPICR